MHDLKTDPGKAVQPESDLGDETGRDPGDEARGPTSGDKPGDLTMSEDPGPPDGGAAAWLVVLGAWCCSFSSPGWINSTYFNFPQWLHKFRYVTSGSDD